MGITKYDGNTPKYSYYIDTQSTKFIVNIELPGGGSIYDVTALPNQGYYSFRFQGEQNGELAPKLENEEVVEGKKDKVYKELDNEKKSSLILCKNLRKKHSIHIEFKISNQAMQVTYDKNGRPKFTMENTRRGIIIFIFDIALINQTNAEKKNQRKFEI